MKRTRLSLLLLFSLPLLICAQEQTSASEWDKISYTLQTDVTASTGKHTPFWLVSNRHGLSSLENNNANLSIGIQRDFDTKEGFTWAYGAEFAGAWHYTSPFYVQQLYADLKYNCWELSIGSKERWSEGKHRTLSGGGLTFAPNARPIPQVRLGINEYASFPWLFNEWVQVKGHLSYGRYTDDEFQRDFTSSANNVRYTTGLLFHEKTAFVRVANPSGKGFGWESGLEMYTKFGGTLHEIKKGEHYQTAFPTSFMEYVKAFIPLPGGASAPDAEQVNINGNVLGSWHAILDYTAETWKFRAYYEHFFEDHSQMFGVSWVPDRNGTTRFLSYHPWQDGLWGLELELPKGKWLKGIVAEYITSRDQSGPILHNSNANFQEKISGFDFYYNHELFQSWQHWGMSVCNPHLLGPSYNENGNLSMPYTRIRSFHIGAEGAPHKEWAYRFMGSHTRHWGSHFEPLINPENITSVMLEVTHSPSKLQGWQCTGAFAADHSALIGNNLGGMITIRKTGFLTKKH